MKKGDVIKLESSKDGKTFTLPWTPVKPTDSEGHGSGKKWPSITFEMWEELFHQLQPYTTAERNELCEKIDGKDYATLNKWYGKNPTLGRYAKNKPERKRVNGRGDELPPLTPLEEKYGAKSRKFANPKTPQQKVGFLMERIESTEKHLAELKKDLATVKEEGIQELEAQLKELQEL